MDRTEKPYSPQMESSILNEEDIQELIEFRKIQPEDIAILESLSRFPNDFFVEFHNFFSLSRERSLQLLEGQLKDPRNKTEERKEFMELLYKFASKYHWTACWNMINVFEKRRKK